MLDSETETICCSCSSTSTSTESTTTSSSTSTTSDSSLLPTARRELAPASTGALPSPSPLPLQPPCTKISIPIKPFSVSASVSGIGSTRTRPSISGSGGNCPKKTTSGSFGMLRVHFIGFFCSLVLLYNINTGISIGPNSYYSYDYLYSYGSSIQILTMPTYSLSDFNRKCEEYMMYGYSNYEQLAQNYYPTANNFNMNNININMNSLSDGFVYEFASDAVKEMQNYFHENVYAYRRISTIAKVRPEEQDRDSIHHENSQEKNNNLTSSPTDTTNHHVKIESSSSPISESISSGYRLDQSTEYNYRHIPPQFYGRHTDLRSTIDYTYHSNYIPTRQLLQDNIISQILEKNHYHSERIIDALNGRSCLAPTSPWIVFTAGAMGSGKSYTIRHLASLGRFPIEQFIAVDPDEIRRLLPEWQSYLDHDAEMAGERTRKEAGLIAELLTQIALRDGRNVLVDGSLKDSDWYKDYFLGLRNEYSALGLRIGILHITAPKEAIFDRARERSKITNRVVPQHILEHAIEKVPRSVKILAPLADFVAELNNAPSANDIELVTNGMTWATFKMAWSQTCKIPEGDDNDNDNGPIMSEEKAKAMSTCENDEIEKSNLVRMFRSKL